jgi:hypothetical protein
MLPPYKIPNCKAMPKEQLPTGIFVTSQTKGWMINKPMKYQDNRESSQRTILL